MQYRPTSRTRRWNEAREHGTEGELNERYKSLVKQVLDRGGIGHGGLILLWTSWI